MLSELHIQQFALIDQVHLHCHAGLTVFSGETGAGKSILIDALGAAFGARASSEWVRHGAKEAEVIAVCEINDTRLDRLLEDQGMVPDDLLILRRVITADGRSRAWVNDRPVSIGFLQAIGNVCLDFHGQHEHQALMQASFQQQLVDVQLSADSLQAIRQGFQHWKQAGKQLEQHHQLQQESGEQLQWMQEQCELLEMLAFEPGLEDELAQRVEAGQHVADIQQAGAKALMLLDEQDDNARSAIAQAMHDVASLSDCSPALGQAEELLQQVDVLLSEAIPLLAEARDTELDLESLQADEERLARLRETLRRHQTDEQGLMDLWLDWQQRCSAMETAAWDEDALKQEVERTREHYEQLAEQLHLQRLGVAGQMTELLHPYLKQLALGGMELNIEVIEERDTPHAEGWDRVEFMVSSNPGEPFRPLTQVASGGELSRLVLSLKAMGAYRDAPAIAVFDEVDVGIGGETAWHVGQLLREMAEQRQIFVISHLPQVAACAQQQCHISKLSADGRTVSRLESLTEDQRIDEIARMLGGTDTESRQHAMKFMQRGSAKQEALASETVI